ncbi:MAG: cobaltochelatase subunit CobT [Rhodospirillaceae bacterium]|nr:cobaltochelatase subunit CobT [Rhodospirillaceae bacterium]|tara:strand:- start:20231 stop:22075 length:1845 start_codon:yes stop_codon:yes gene_type:complete
MYIVHNEDSKSDVFQRALCSAIRAIARKNSDEINISFGSDIPKLVGNEIQLPYPSHDLDSDDVSKVRGAADSLALRLRYHDEDAHSKSMPRGRKARQIFDVVEQVRIEAHGSEQMPGLADNLESALTEKCRMRGYQDISSPEEIPMAEAIGLLMREKLINRELPKNAQNVADLWRPWFETQLIDRLEDLLNNTSNQTAFAKILNELISDLDLNDEDFEDPNDADPQSEADAEQEENNDDGATQDGEQIEGETAEDSDSATSDETDISEMMDADPEISPSDGEQDADDSGNQPYLGNKDSNTVLENYKSYSIEFDEIIHAADLCDVDELNRLRQQLDQQLSHMQSIISKLANRLQRKLMARQVRSWQFDLDDGLLDTGRLSRVVTNPLHPLSYKQEKETKFRDTVVTLLIDNSGSMRGRPILVAAMSADILARTLERCGVKVEILGFTTRAWKGGQSRERWLVDGRPNNPGRLNDLRHIVYKSGDEPWRRARKNLGLMQKEGLLKENIDGEALLWAHSRLLQRHEERRILMVISDGAPVDDSTLSVNARNYLEQHLRDVIKNLETNSPVELLAIGIGHDVTRYYRKAVTLTDAEQLGGTMTEKLAELFDEELINA